MGSRQREAVADVLENMRRSQRQFSATLLAEFKPYNTRLLQLYRKAAQNLTNVIQAFIQTLEQGQPQTPALQRLQNDAVAALSVLQAPMLEFSQRLQASGVRTGVDLAERNLEQGRQQPIGTDPALIATSVLITELPDFRETINRYAPYFAGYIVLRLLNSSDPVLEARSLISQFRNTTRAPLPQALSTLTQTTRTAQLWSARLATQQTYHQNGILTWIWSAALDYRTCVACWSMHGTIHPITEILDDHYNGRCAMIPQTQTIGSIFGGDLEFETPRGLDAEMYFNSLTDAQQLQIMGRGRYEAYHAGMFEFSDMSKQVSVPIYGTMRVPKTLAELTGSITP